MPKPKPFLVIGHRGDGAGPDENTLASCQRAVRSGAGAVELDVRLRGDELVLAHDIARGVSPRLNDVLPKLRVPVVLHLKRANLSPWHDLRALKQLSEVRHRPGLTVSSRWPGTLAYAKRRYPRLRTAFITHWAGWDLAFAKRLGVAEYHVWYWTLTERAMRKARRKRIPLLVFVPSGSAAEKLRKLRVRGVITDDVSSFARSRASGRTR